MDTNMILQFLCDLHNTETQSDSQKAFLLTSKVMQSEMQNFKDLYQTHSNYCILIYFRKYSFNKRVHSSSTFLLIHS